VRVGNREVKFSNPDKLFFPEQGLTKGDLTKGMWRRKVSPLPRFEQLGLEPSSR
jgi:DNA primase